MDGLGGLLDHHILVEWEAYNMWAGWEVYWTTTFWLSGRPILCGPPHSGLGGLLDHHILVEWEAYTMWVGWEVYWTTTFWLSGRPILCGHYYILNQILL